MPPTSPPAPPCSCERFDRATSTWKVCPKKAKICCKECGLVNYCGEECKTAHKNLHSKICQTNKKDENWVPNVNVEDNDDKVLYGLTNLAGIWPRFPSIDLLQLENNEGVDYSKDLNIMVASCPDLKNAFLPIIGLPDGYDKRVEITLVDQNENVIIRNLFILIIAFRLGDVPKALDAMVHLFYSFAVPGDMWEAITELLLPYFEDFYRSVKHKKPDVKVSKSWTFGSRTIRATMSRRDWKRIMEILKPDVPMSFDQAVAARKAVVSHAAFQSFRALKLWNADPYYRRSDIRFRQTGILLPFGRPVSRYRTPNLTFFGSSGEYIGPVLLSPRDSYWPDSLIFAASSAWRHCHDAYAEIYHDHRAFFKKFIRRVKNLNVNTHLYAADYEKLHGTLGCSASSHANGLLFDRIFASNLADDDRLGFEKTVGIFTPRLKSQRDNPHATLVIMHTTALIGAKSPWPIDLEDLRVASRSGDAKTTEEGALKMMTLNESFWSRDAEMPNSPRWLRFDWSKYFFMSHDKMWERYCAQEKVEAVALAAGLVAKQTNTIVDKWQYQAKGLRENKMTQYRNSLDNLLHTGLHGAEVSTEWVKP